MLGCQPISRLCGLETSLMSVSEDLPINHATGSRKDLMITKCYLFCVLCYFARLRSRLTGPINVKYLRQFNCQEVWVSMEEIYAERPKSPRTRFLHQTPIHRRTKMHYSL